MRKRKKSEEEEEEEEDLSIKKSQLSQSEPWKQRGSQP